MWTAVYHTPRAQTESVSQHTQRIQPDDWRIVQRADGWWLQRKQESGAWRDMRGPYKQRGGAAAYYQRLVAYAIRTERSETTGQHTNHWWYEMSRRRRCRICGVEEDLPE